MPRLTDMARRVLEVSIFWKGELLAIRYDDPGLPATNDVVVRTRVCEVAPRKRSPIDLPLGALGVVAALLHVVSLASFTSSPPEHVATSETHGTASYAVTTEPTFASDAVVPAPTQPARFDTNRECPGLANYMLVNHLKRPEL